MQPTHRFSRIAVLGLGYIGLPTAAVFAGRGIEVVGVDVNPRIVEQVNAGLIHIIEPDLDVFVRDVVAAGYLRATTEVETADAYVVAVPTPMKERTESPAPDLSYVLAAAVAIAPVLKSGDLVVIESTCPVGATDMVAALLAGARPDLSFPQDDGAASDVRIAYCPERVLPGQVLRELVQNDRVIGGMSPRCSAAAAALYSVVVEGNCIVTNSRTAEMVKLTENSFRDVNIAFANELSLICAELEIDVWELISLANRHPRVAILKPGPGVGGHCIAIDPWFIVSRTPRTARLIRTAREVNDAKPAWVVAEVDRMLGALLRENPSRTAADVTVAAFGLSFKADIDDLRESPACAIVRALAERHPGRLLAVEPHVETLPEGWPDGIEKCDADAALDAADVLVLLVDHKAFARIPPARLGGKKIVDTRGIWTRPGDAARGALRHAEAEADLVHDG